MNAWNWLATALNISTRNRTTERLISSATTSEISLELRPNDEQTDFACFSAYEFSNILRSGKAVGWCEWHLNIPENNNAIEAAKKFYQDFEKLTESSSIADSIITIEKTFLDFKPKSNEWDRIKDYLKQARENNDPLLMVKAYTTSKEFTNYINNDSAANTYHALQLYCTILNCPILARTQEYTEAITRILFHPKLTRLLVRNKTVYRGIFLEDKNLVANYKEGLTIITTTFLSTSTNPQVADIYGPAATEHTMSISCTYNICNTKRHTALNVSEMSQFQDEEEILILRYVPFTIKSLVLTDDGRKMTICFDECNDQ